VEETVELQLMPFQLPFRRDGVERGRWRDVSPWVLFFAVLFVVRYVCMGLGVV